jgi:hypothetical protein
MNLQVRPRRANTKPKELLSHLRNGESAAAPIGRSSADPEANAESALLGARVVRIEHSVC